MSTLRDGNQCATKLPTAPLRGVIKPLHGIITPLVTPLKDRDSLDEAGLESLIEYVLGGGVQGLFVLGTSGEAAALSVSVRRQLLKCVARLTAGRVPVLAGISDNSVVDALTLAAEFADLGATAIVLSTPSYLPVEDAEIARHIRIFADESPLPIILYNMPRLTSHWISINTVQQALQHGNVIGMKDSSGDMSYFTKVCHLIAERPDWSLFMGSETLLADAVKLGADGCVAGGSNVWPLLLVEIYHAAHKGDQARLDALEPLLAELGSIYQFGTYASGAIRGIKCALEIMGICSSKLAEPFESCGVAQRAEIERQLRRLGLLVDKSRDASPRDADLAVRHIAGRVTD